MKNPYSILGVTESATDEEIRAAYLRLLQRWPPERDGARFQEITEAYRAVENQVLRARLKLFGLPCETNVNRMKMTEFFPTERERRRPGVDFWLKMLEMEETEG